MDNFSAPPIDLSHSRCLHRLLMRRLVTGLVLTGVLLGLLSMVLLYRSHSKQTEAELSFEMNLQRTILETEIDRLRQLAVQISSRSQIRQALEKFNQGETNLASLKAFTVPKLVDAMRLMPDIMGITRLDAAGHPRIQVGMLIPSAFWPDAFHEASVQLGDPQKIAGQTRLVVSAPIHNRKGARVGTDLVVFNGHRLSEVVQGFKQRYPMGRVSMVALTGKGMKLLFGSKIASKSGTDQVIRKKLKPVLMASSHGLHLIAGNRENEVVFHQRIGNTQWFFLFVNGTDDFYSPARRYAFQAGGALFLMTLIGSFLTFLFIRPLSGRISVENDALLSLLKERDHLLHQVRAKQIQFQAILDHSLAVISLKDTDGRFLLVNKRFTTLFDIPSDDVIGKTDYDLFPVELANVYRAHDRLVLDKQTPMQFDEQMVEKQRVHDYLSVKFPLYDTNGHVCGMCAIATDITERKQMEDKLRQSEQRLSLLLNTLPHGVQENDIEGVITYSNLAHHQILGYPPGELIGRHIWDFQTHSETRQALSDYLAYLVAEQPRPTPYVTRNLTRQGQTVDLEIIWDYRRDAEGKLTGFICIISDITRRIRSEQALRESEARFRTLAEFSPAGIVLTDPQGHSIYVNDRFAELVDLSPDAYLGSHWRKRIHPEDREWVSRKWTQAVGEKSIFRQEHRWLHGNGRVVWTLVLAAPIFDANEKLQGYVGSMIDITQQKEAEQELARANAEWTQAMDQYDDAIYLLDMQRRLVRANQAFYQLVEFDSRDCAGRPIGDLIHPTGGEESCLICQAQLSGREGRYILESGDPGNPFSKPIELTLKLVRDGSENPIGVMVSLHDLSRSRQLEERLRLAARVFENIGEGVVITDSDGNIVEVNPAFTAILGYTREEVLGRNPKLWNSGIHDESFYQGLWNSVDETGFWQGELWNRRKDGSVFPEWLTISSVLDGNGEVTHYVGVFSDISQIKQSQEKLEHLAHHDALTDLPNRSLLNERLEQAIRHAVRHGKGLVVFFLDLDNFKHINDSFGHPIGDQLLQKVAEKLRQTVRAEDTVARLGGDEFVVLMEDIGRPQDSDLIAEKVISAFSEPFRLEDQEIRISASVGISLYPRDGEDPISLLRNADAAMYRAKEDGRSTYRFYTEDLTKRAFERVFLETNLRQAIDKAQLYLCYQPQVDLSSGRVTGVEALVRWQHPELGLVSPDKFIPLAEESGWIHSIGAWVLDTACEQGKKWLIRGIDFGRISVNVAGPQLQRGQMVTAVKKALEHSGLDASLLELEVTEGFIMQQAGKAIDQLKSLRDLGVILAIDDFGTGYSSLSYLKKLPIQKLKIDQSFIRDIPSDRHDMAIAEAVIALGKCLELSITAEGVETIEQARFLEGAGCQAAQGHLFSAPLDPAGLERWLSEWKTKPFKVSLQRK